MWCLRAFLGVFSFDVHWQDGMSFRHGPRQLFVLVKGVGKVWLWWARQHHAVKMVVVMVLLLFQQMNNHADCLKYYFFPLMWSFKLTTHKLIPHFSRFSVVLVICYCDTTLRRWPNHDKIEFFIRTETTNILEMLSTYYCPYTGLSPEKNKRAGGIFKKCAVGVVNQWCPKRARQRRAVQVRYGGMPLNIFSK